MLVLVCGNCGEGSSGVGEGMRRCGTEWWDFRFPLSLFPPAALGFESLSKAACTFTLCVVERMGVGGNIVMSVTRKANMKPNEMQYRPFYEDPCVVFESPVTRLGKDQDRTEP